MKVVKLKKEGLVEMVMSQIKEETVESTNTETNISKDDELINKLIDKLVSSDGKYEVVGSNMITFNGSEIKLITDGIVKVGEHEFHISKETEDKLKKLTNPLKEEESIEVVQLELSGEEAKFLKELLVHPDLGFDNEKEEQIVKNILKKLK